MLLALKNLWLPIHNREFATFIGLIYLVFAWVFQISVADPTDAVKRAQTAGIQQECILYNPLAGAKRDKCVSDRNAALTKTMQSTDQKTSGYVQPSPPAGAVASNSRDLGLPGVADMDSKWFIDWLAQAKQGGWLELARDFIWTQISVERIVSAMLSNPAFFFMIAGLFSGLIYYVGNGDAEFKPRWLKWPVKFALGIPHASAHVFILLATNVVLQPILGIFTKDGTAWPWMLVGVGLYSMLMVLIGGLLGGMLFGLYWVLTSIIGRMHMDSFGALGITGYKNFLRLRIMPDTLTIYPIGLDKVPGRNGWRALTRDDDASMHNPLIKPKSPLRPRLIEPPIEIVAPAAQRRPAPGWT